MTFLDSCCEPEVAQGVEADTVEMRARVQAIRGSWKYRKAGLSYAAARAVVVMQQQSELPRLRRGSASP